MGSIKEGNIQTALAYQSGFGNEFASEGLPGALPQGRNSPQRNPYGLYAEVLSGTAFTAPRAENQRTWLYKIQPSAMQSAFRRIDNRLLRSGPFTEAEPSPNRMRWDPLPVDDAPADFIDGLTTMAGSGEPAAQAGLAIHIYRANRSMSDRYFVNADGEMMLVPQSGELLVFAETGRLKVSPGEICVVPRGMKFKVELLSPAVRGYLCENYGAQFRLPELGPIGSNGLANPRDFLTPHAAYEDIDAPHELVAKFMGHLWSAKMEHSPIDVVAWHGNYAPYRYDLRRFNTIGSISFDHPDPSIFLVLHSPSDSEGVSNLDFVIFPPRWLVAQNTFRPPWFHRNVASEFMGLVHGAYDAKAEGFLPGGASLHNCMSGHGPDAATFEKASAAELSKPDVIVDTMAFMLEAPRVIRPTRQALDAAHRQPDYPDCWSGLKAQFDPNRP